MNIASQRALLLFDQGRFADAERELRGALAQEPHDAFNHAMLALSIAARPAADSAALAEATDEAEQAVGLAPYEPFAHYARAKVLYQRHRYVEAGDAIREAIRLDAQNPSYFGLLGSIRFDQRRWTEALEAADQGLAIDPENDWCVNIRTMALVQLGRRDEAGAAIGDALARNPDNAYTHANQGWALLHRGEHRQALEHFREALRLDPELDHARAGIVESLKARHFIYRVMLRYYLFMSRLSSGAQWGILIGGYLLYRLLGNAAASNPSIAPFVAPVLIAYAGFAIMSWLASPVFNLMLRLNRFGRLALSRNQIVQSNITGVLLLTALAALTAGLVRDDVNLLMLALRVGLLTLPVSVIFQLAPGWPRQVMIGACAVLAALALASTALLHNIPVDNPNDSRWSMDMVRRARLGLKLETAYTYVLLASMIGANFLRSVQPKR